MYPIDMKILGIETSCDETACGIVEDGNKLLSNTVLSSMDLHAAYGGVVPEIAARSHIESIIPVVEQSLQQAKCTWADIDGIAVTFGAGLGGCLLVGVMTARTLAITKNKPLYAINHVEAHIYANFLTSAGSLSPAFGHSPEAVENSLRDTALESPLLSRSSLPTASSAARSRLVSHQSPTDVQEWKLGGQVYTLPKDQPVFPMLGLIVSGGHSQLVLWRGHFDYTLLGQTQDDAIGEAFDKVAKILGLPYPGGPSISEAAKHGDPYAYNFPKANMYRPPRPQFGDGAQGSSENRKGAVRKSTATAAHSDNAAIRAIIESRKYDYSFSGLKTAVLRAAQQQIGEGHDFPSRGLAERLSDGQKANIAASFQRIAVETVADKTLTAYEEFKPNSVVIGGGVASSPELRKQLADRLPLPISYSDRKLCTDNGAMVAALGCYKAMLGQPAADPYTLDIAPNLSM